MGASDCVFRGRGNVGHAGDLSERSRNLRDFRNVERGDTRNSHPTGCTHSAEYTYPTGYTHATEQTQPTGYTYTGYARTRIPGNAQSRNARRAGESSARHAGHPVTWNVNCRIPRRSIGPDDTTALAPPNPALVRQLRRGARRSRGLATDENGRCPIPTMSLFSYCRHRNDSRTLARRAGTRRSGQAAISCSLMHGK
jgi:hypothetical protein